MTTMRSPCGKALTLFLCLASWSAMPTALADDAKPEAPKPEKKAPASNTQEVKKASLAADIDATGTFYPVDPVEVKLKLDAYKGELKILSAAAPGAEVKQGDVLLQIDPTDLQRDIKAAANEYSVVAASLVKAKADATMGAEADALAKEMSDNALAQAEAGLKWWDDLLGPQMLQSAEMRTKQAKAYVEDQEDELDQLRKMYKSEDLTAATADIVIKRAVRALENSKLGLTMTEGQAKKTKENDYAQSRKSAEYALTQAKQQSAQLAAAQAHGKVVRQAGLNSARFAAQASKKKLDELKADLEKLTVKAPQDGVVFFGSLQGGAWQGNDPRAVRTGEKLAASPAPIMTLYTPGKYKVIFDVPESKLGWIEPGMEVKLKPIAFPQFTCKGQLSAIPVVGKAGAGEQTFEMSVECPGVENAALKPGMKVAAHIDGKTVDSVLALPKDAISGTKIKVRDADGNEHEKDVVTGRTDGKLVEIISGVEEGEMVVTGAKS